MVHCATSLAETLIGVTSGGWLSCSASERITRSRATPLGVACLMRVGIAPSGTVSAAYRCSKSSHTSNKHATWRQVLHTQETANPVSPAAKTDAWEVGSVPAPPSHRPDPTLPSGARGRVREGRQGAAQLRGGCAAQQVGHSAHRLWCGTLLDSQCTVQALPVTAPTSVTALHSLFAPTPRNQPGLLTCVLGGGVASPRHGAQTCELAHHDHPHPDTASQRDRVGPVLLQPSDVQHNHPLDTVCACVHTSPTCCKSFLLQQKPHRSLSHPLTAPSRQV